MAIAAAVLTACGPAPDPKMVVVLADVSASVPDFAAYREAWKKVVASLGPGDRVVLSLINGATASHFPVIVDQRMPAYNWWSDVEMEVEAAQKELIGGLDHAMEAVVEGTAGTARGTRRNPNQATQILTALHRTSQAMQSHHGQRVLLVLSDMVEDSEYYRFDRIRVDSALAEKVLSRQREEGGPPRLDGVRVYVAGASGMGEKKARELELFWRAYFTGCGAEVVAWLPVLLNFEEQ